MRLRRRKPKVEIRLWFAEDQLNHFEVWIGNKRVATVPSDGLALTTHDTVVTVEEGERPE